MSAAEVDELCACLMVTVDSECLADWEFESLVGTTRDDARAWVASRLAGAELDELLLDRVVTMLSLFAGSTQALAGSLRADVIGHMLDKLVWAPHDLRLGRTEPKSAVTWRAEHVPSATRAGAALRVEPAHGTAMLTHSATSAPSTTVHEPAKRERKHSRVRMREQAAHLESEVVTSAKHARRTNACP